jgi:hypothetical protein
MFGHESFFHWQAVLSTSEIDDFGHGMKYTPDKETDMPDFHLAAKGRRLSVSIVLFFIFALQPGFSQELVLSFVDGVVEIDSGSSWSAMSEGDTVSVGSLIRVTGSAELLGGPVKILISRDGTWRVDTLYAAALRKNSTGLDSQARKKLDMILDAVQSKRSDRTSAMGIRGEQMDRNFDSPGKAENIDPEDASDNEALYYLAFDYDRMDRKALALRTLDKASPGPMESLYRETLLLKASLLVDSASFGEAIAELAPLIRGDDSPAYLQAALILASYAYRGLGDTGAAKEALARARDLGPGDAGKEAERILQEL